MQRPRYRVIAGILMIVLLLLIVGLFYCCYRGCPNENSSYVHTNPVLPLQPIHTCEVNPLDVKTEIQCLMNIEI